MPMSEFDKAYFRALRQAAKVAHKSTGLRKVPKYMRADVKTAAGYTAKRSLLPKYDPDAAIGMGPVDLPIKELAKRAMTKLEAVSMERYNGGVRIKRQYGSSTVTRFLVRPKGSKALNDPGAVMVEGYGPTPGERKTYAMKKAAQILWERGVL
jgi:hypothetical protein